MFVCLLASLEFQLKGSYALNLRGSCVLNFEMQGGSSNKVVDCILCLKGFYEWKLSGGVGVWKYGGTVRITSFPKKSPSSIVGSESADESLDESESSQYEQLLEFLNLSEEFLIEETRTASALAFLFDNFGLRLLQAYLRETEGIEDLPLNAMVGKILTGLDKCRRFYSRLYKNCFMTYMISR